MTRAARKALILALAAPIAALSACSGSSPGHIVYLSDVNIGAHGPTVRIQNDSDVALLARYWVARVDTREPSGFTDQRTGPRLEVLIQPGEDIRTRCGRPGWLTGNEDGIVWARFQPVIVDDADTITPIGDPVWYELSRPGPYHILVSGTAFPIASDLDDLAAMPRETLVFQPLTDRTGPLTPLPRSAWIEHHDGFFAQHD